MLNIAVFAPIAEGKRQNSDQSERGRFAKLAKSEPKVVHVVTVIIRHEGQ